MIATHSIKSAVLTVLYLKRERLGLTYEDTLALADEIVQYASNFVMINAAGNLEASSMFWNDEGSSALRQLSAQQLLDILEAAQHVNVDQSFVDELNKELQRKITQ